MKKFDQCPCGTGKSYTTCCEALLSGQRTAQNPEELMRSRYTAYVAKKVDYLVGTTHPAARTDLLADALRKGMRQVEWLKLHVVATDATHVEFIAEYISDTAPGRHHECSVFEQVNGAWFYLGEESESE